MHPNYICLSLNFQLQGYKKVMGDKETGPSSLFSLKHDKNILHPKRRKRDTKTGKAFWLVKICPLRLFVCFVVALLFYYTYVHSQYWYLATLTILSGSYKPLSIQYIIPTSIYLNGRCVLTLYISDHFYVFGICFRNELALPCRWKGWSWYFCWVYWNFFWKKKNLVLSI